jgi:hypothetical protein
MYRAIVINVQAMYRCRPYRIIQDHSIVLLAERRASWEYFFALSCTAGFEFLTAVVKRSVFWDITPCSPLKFNWRFERTCRLCLPPLLATRFSLVSCLSYSLTLIMEAICSSEASVDLQRTPRRYIPEDRTLYDSKIILNQYTILL